MCDCWQVATKSFHFVHSGSNNSGRNFNRRVQLETCAQIDCIRENGVFLLSPCRCGWLLLGLAVCCCCVNARSWPSSFRFADETVFAYEKKFQKHVEVSKIPLFTFVRKNNTEILFDYDFLVVRILRNVSILVSKKNEGIII